MKSKKMILIYILTPCILMGVFTELYANAWCLLTYNNYFIPKESSVFTFKFNEISDGSGEAWLYGEDNKNYYGLNIDEGTEFTPPYFTLQKGLEIEGFDKLDYKTWKLK